MKAHPSTPCSWSLSSTPLTICTFIIWGSSGPNKIHVLINFEGVMTSGPQPMFIWFSKRGPENRLRFRHVTVVLSPTCLAWPHFRGTKLCLLVALTLKSCPAWNPEAPGRFTLTFVDFQMSKLRRKFWHMRNKPTPVPQMWRHSLWQNFISSNFFCFALIVFVVLTLRRLLDGSSA